VAGVVLTAFVLALVGPGVTQRATSATRAHNAKKYTLTFVQHQITCPGGGCDSDSTWFKDNAGELRCLHGVTHCLYMRAKYPAGTVVKLKAGADAPLIPTGWFDACSTTGVSCTLVMDSDKSVGVEFDKAK